jgi:hypothetical protein
LRSVALRSSKGHVAPAPTVATGDLEAFRAQAQAMAAGGALELDAAMVSKIMADRERGVFGAQNTANALGQSGTTAASRTGITAPRSTAAPSDLHDYKDAAMQLAQRLAAIAGDDDSDSGATASSFSEEVVHGTLQTPTKNDPKRQRALAFTPSQPPSTSANTQLLDFKAQAEALAAQLAEAAAADAQHDDALSSSESAEDNDPASETTDTPPKHGSLRDPIEKQMHTSDKKRAALKYTPKAPAPTGAASELGDFRSQAMQLAEQLRSLATTDDSADSADSSSLPGSEQTSANSTLRLPEGVRAPYPTMKEKTLASYAAQAELLVAKLAEVERARKSDAPRRHRSRSHKTDAAAAAADASSSAAAAAAAPAAAAASSSASSANSGAVVDRLRSAALARKNSRDNIDSGSSSPVELPASPPTAPADEKSDKPQRRGTKSKGTQPVIALTAVAALANTSTENLKEKDKSQMQRKGSVSKPTDRT